MKHANELSRIALLSIFSVLVSFKSVAQEVPSSVDPGQLERELKGASEPIRIRPTSPELGVSQPIADVPEGAEELSFILRSVTFQGDQSAFSEQDLLGKFSERIGQEITVAETLELVDGEHKIRVYKNYLIRMQQHLNGRGFKVDSIGRFDESTKRAFLEYKKGNNIVGPALPDSLCLVFVLSQGKTQ